MQKNIQVKSIAHLKRLTNLKEREGYILLSGNIRSTKTVYYENKIFIVNNFIDGSSQNLTQAGLYTESNIGEAIANQSFFITQ